MGVPLPLEGVGIAGLLSADMHQNITTRSSSNVLDYIFDAELQLQDAVKEDIDYQHLDTWLQQHVAELQRSTAVQTPASDAPSSSAAAAQPSPLPGRLGPADVAIDRASVCGQFSYSSDGMTIESLGNFSSCRANVAVFKGKWMYECTVLTPGIQQVSCIACSSSPASLVSMCTCTPSSHLHCLQEWVKFMLQRNASGSNAWTTLLAGQVVPPADAYRVFISGCLQLQESI